MATLTHPSARVVVRQEMARRREADHPAFLRALMAHAAAGIVVIEGEREAAEAVYRLGDAVVGRGS